MIASGKGNERGNERTCGGVGEGINYKGERKDEENKCQNKKGNRKSEGNIKEEGGINQGRMED